MLTLSPAVRIYLATGATDLRGSIDGLAALVRERFTLDPLSGHLFLSRIDEATRSRSWSRSSNSSIRSKMRRPISIPITAGSCGRRNPAPHRSTHTTRLPRNLPPASGRIITARLSLRSDTISEEFLAMNPNAFRTIEQLLMEAFGGKANLANEDKHLEEAVL